MLTQLSQPEQAMAKLAGDRVRGFTFRNFLNIGEDGHRPKVLADDPADPRVLVAHAGSNFMFSGELHCFGQMMADLLAGNVEQEGGWPDEQMQKDWDEHGEGGRGFFLNTAPYHVWRAGVLAGFEPNPDDSVGQVAYQWHWEGAPRLGHLIKHPCRVVHGLELLEPMKLAVHYDPEGNYIRQCLEHGPSFVCEVDGEPKCWSCTHLSGTMGMIYTPDEHRRHGYAKSLSALQIDHMLERDGIACCHVIDHNTASMNLVAGLGAQVTPEPLVWRVLWWPGERPEKKEDNNPTED